jgi:polyhydroxyalkanoate synthesis regulator phasin
MGSRRRGNTFTRFLEDIVDDTKDLVDDLIDRAKDVEEDAKDAVVDLVDDDDDDDGDTRDATEAAALRKQLDELRAKIDQLTAMQKPE